MRIARSGWDGWRVVGAVSAGLELGATGCGGGGYGPGPGVGSAGPVVLADPGVGELVVVAPDGGDRRTVEGGSVLAGGPRLVTVGVAGTAVAGDDEGALYLVRAGEARAVQLLDRVGLPAKEWALAYEIDAVREGWLIKERFEDHSSGGMQTYAINTRREKF